MIWILEQMTKYVDLKKTNLSSYTHVTLQKYFPTTFNYMKKYSIYNDTSRAIKAVKDG